MKYPRFEDLPDFIRSYVKELAGDKAPQWVRERTPALQGRTFLDLCNQEGILAAARYLSDVGSKFGIPEGVKIAADYKESYPEDDVLSKKAVASAHENLKGKSLQWEKNGVSEQLEVASIFCYGAVAIDPKHLVIWVLLSGPSEGLVPEWCTNEPNPQDLDKTDALDPPLHSFLREIQTEILKILRTAGWTHGDPFVGFESAKRVAQGGGWHYFK